MTNGHDWLPNSNEWIVKEAKANKRQTSKTKWLTQDTEIDLIGIDRVQSKVKISDK